MADDVYVGCNGAVIGKLGNQDCANLVENFRDFVKGTLGPVFKKNSATKDLKIMALDDNRMWLPNWADKVRCALGPQSVDQC